MMSSADSHAMDTSVAVAAVDAGQVSTNSSKRRDGR